MVSYSSLSLSLSFSLSCLPFFVSSFPQLSFSKMVPPCRPCHALARLQESVWCLIITPVRAGSKDWEPLDWRKSLLGLFLREEDGWEMVSEGHSSFSSGLSLWVETLSSRRVAEWEHLQEAVCGLFFRVSSALKVHHLLLLVSTFGPTMSPLQ